MFSMEVSGSIFWTHREKDRQTKRERANERLRLGERKTEREIY